MLVIISIDIIVYRLLIDGRKIGWFFSLGIFGLYFLNFVSVATAPLHSLEYIDFRQVYAFLSIPNLVAVVILLVDRENYFAAAERGKKGDGGAG